MAAQDQPTAASARTGHLLIAAHSFPAGATTTIGAVAAFWRSDDGGATFPILGVVPGLVRGFGGVFQGASDLSLGCSPSGECYLASFVYDQAISRSAIAVSRSSDGGTTWLPPVFLIDETDPAFFNLRPSIAAAGSSVYVSWIRVEGGGSSVPVWFAASHDGGATFTAPNRISDPVADRLTNKPATVVDGNGRIYVVYKSTLQDDPQGRNRHVVQISTDGGATFGAARLVAFTFETFVLSPMVFRINSFPQVAIEPGNALLVAWADSRSGNPDVVLTRSTDGGVTWTTPVRVTDTPLGKRIQYALPALACGPQGVCGVSFYTDRAQEHQLDTYFAPIVWGQPGPNLRVSTVPMDPDAQFDGRFIGDYNALVIDANAAHPVWTDTRVELPAPQHDIFTARITAQ